MSARRVQPIRVYRPMQMGNLFGDLLSGVETAVVSTASGAVQKLSSSLARTTGLMAPDAAAAASKQAIENLQKTRMSRGASQAVVSDNSPVGSSEAPSQVIVAPAAFPAWKTYLPYIAGGAGVLLLVVILVRRR